MNQKGSLPPSPESKSFPEFPGGLVLAGRTSPTQEPARVLVERQLSQSLRVFRDSRMSSTMAEGGRPEGFPDCCD